MGGDPHYFLGASKYGSSMDYMSHRNSHGLYLQWYPKNIKKLSKHQKHGLNYNQQKP